jgi:DNA-binding LacI/PurR family transcriptional regulator
MQYAKRNGVLLNEDISFVSFANLPITHYMENPPLASVEQFPYEQGNMAAKMLWDLLDNSGKSISTFQKEILDSKLVIHSRETQSPIPEP